MPLAASNTCRASPVSSIGAYAGTDEDEEVESIKGADVDDGVEPAVDFLAANDGVLSETVASSFAPLLTLESLF